jgi:prophage regulatory protein
MMNDHRRRALAHGEFEQGEIGSGLPPPITTKDRLDAIPLRFIRFAAVRERTGLSRSTIWRLERQGAFPKHRRISRNAVGWLEQEINEWVLWRAQSG